MSRRSALLSSLAPVKGFGTALKAHYEQFEEAVGGAGADTPKSPKERVSGDSGALAVEAPRKYPEFSTLVGSVLGGSQDHSYHSSVSSQSEDYQPSTTAESRLPIIPSPTGIIAAIGVPSNEEGRVSKPETTEGEDLNSFLENLRRNSFRDQAPRPVFAEEGHERDHQVGLFLDTLIPKTTASTRASVPAIVPPDILTEAPGLRATAHRKTMA